MVENGFLIISQVMQTPCRHDGPESTGDEALYTRGFCCCCQGDLGEDFPGDDGGDEDFDSGEGGDEVLVWSGELDGSVGDSKG